MRLNTQKDRISKYGAAYLLVAVLFMNFPVSAQAALGANITANGQDNSLTLSSATESFNIAVSSTDATACQLTSPAVSGVATTANMNIVPGHPWYPASGSSVTFTVSCTDGTSSVTDSVVVNLGGTTGGGGSTTPTVDIKANGSDGPVTLTSGQTYTYTWISANATACQLTSPETSGISLNGTSSSISAGHPWYPLAGGSVTLTISCTDGTTSVTDSVVVNLGGTTGGGGSTTPTVDIKANGSDGPVTLTSGQTYTYTWISANATACQLTSPETSGISLNGTSSSISAGHPWYPTASSTVTLTIVCTNGTANATDSVVINLGGTTGVTTPTVDIKANGSDGPVVLNNGEQYVYTWTSANATACQLTSPETSGISLTGTSSPIVSGHPWYPTTSSPVTLTIVCTNGTANATDSVVVELRTSGGGGGGGGGGGRSRSRGSVQPGEVLGAATVNVCPFINTYMRYGYQNDSMEVMRLQAFLKVVEGHDYVTINGVFDQATLQAVHSFQQKYSNDVLRPWGTNQSTGYVYILTLAKVNQILCGSGMPNVTPAPVYKAPAKAAPAPVIVDKEGGCVCQDKEGGSGTTTPLLPVVGENASGTVTKGQKLGSVAAAIFAGPDSLYDLMQCAYEFVLILIVLYILGSLLSNVLYKDVPENVRKKFWTKWITVAAGLVVSLIGAYLLNEWCLILPLLISLVLTLVWMTLFPKHSSLRVSAKSWYLVTSARGKSMLNKNKPEIAIEKK